MSFPATQPRTFPNTNFSLPNAVGFSPKDVDSLIAWYDVTEETYNDNDLVPQLSDLSGNGHHLVQATEAKQPTYIANSQNGLPVVRFDGVDDVLSNSNSMTFPITIIFTTKTNENISHMITGKDSVGRIYYNQSTEYQIYSGASIAYPITQPMNFHMHSNLFNGVNSYIRYNGTEKITGDTGSTEGSIISNIVVGANGNSYFYSGDVGEFIIYNRELTSSEINNIENYLAQKWGITI